MSFFEGQAFDHGLCVVGGGDLVVAFIVYPIPL